MHKGKNKDLEGPNSQIQMRDGQAGEGISTEVSRCMPLIPSEDVAQKRILLPKGNYNSSCGIQLLYNAIWRSG